MPELPDVAHFKSYLDSTALHEPIATVRVLDPDILEATSVQKLQRSLKRRRFEATCRHGKFLFVRCDEPARVDDAGNPLEDAPAIRRAYSFWFAWDAMHPQVAVYQP